MQKRLRAELATLPKNYSSVDLAALPYLDAFLRETLRVYPPAPSPMPRVVPQRGFSFKGVDYPPNVSSSTPSCARRSRHLGVPDLLTDLWCFSDNYFCTAIHYSQKCRHFRKAGEFQPGKMDWGLAGRERADEQSIHPLFRWPTRVTFPCRTSVACKIANMWLP